MATTPNMSLTKWAGGDYFSRSALSANFDAIDAHDHSGAPKGTPIPTAGLQNLAVTSPKLADAAVSTAKIADAAVSPVKIATLPAARVSISTLLSIPDSTTTYVAFDTEIFDTANLHSTVSNLDRLTAPIAGTYIIGADIYWAASVAGYRTATIVRNSGNTRLSRSWITPISGSLYHTLSTVTRLSAGDYVRLGLYQNSGSNTQLGIDGETTGFWMAWIGP